MGKVKLEFWRVRWDGVEHQKGQTVVSAVGYTKAGADTRAEILTQSGYTNVEVFESKPGSDEEI
jgi:hypothetical protein